MNIQTCAQLKAVAGTLKRLRGEPLTVNRTGEHSTRQRSTTQAKYYCTQLKAMTGTLKNGAVSHLRLIERGNSAHDNAAQIQ